MDTGDTVGSRAGADTGGGDGQAIQRTVGSATVSVVRGSLLDQDVDAVVNAANTKLSDGGGITGLIFDAAGPGLAEEIRQRFPGGTATGTAVMTGGHGLRQPWIIHTPGPDCRQRQRTDHREMFISSYWSCLAVADGAGLSSLAYCSISTGIYGCPLAPCARLAVRTVLAYLEDHPGSSLTRVVFAMHGEMEHLAFQHALQES